MTLVHNKAECPDYTGKACLVSLGLTQLSVIELCLNSYFEVIVLSLLQLSIIEECLKKEVQLLQALPQIKSCP